MNNIFVLGLFPEHNKAFLKLLCENFKVFMFKGHNARAFSDLDFQFAEDVVGDLQFPYADFAWELYQSADETEQMLAQLLACDEKNSRLAEDEFRELHNIAFPVYLNAFIFSQLVEKINIDIVVVNADYSAFRRPVVIEARRRGIPVLDIEHGFFAMEPEPGVLNENFLPATPYVSDFVNLDNDLELEIWQQHYALSELKSGTKFVINGTPNDFSYDTNLSRENAIATLGLAADKFTLSLIASWIEARCPSYLFNAQIEQVEFYKFVFHGLRDYSRKDDLQIVVKLHPAFAVKQVLADAQHYLLNLAEQCGLERVLIILTNLSEVLSASDMIICANRTSVLWESFLASVPAFIYPTQSAVKYMFKPDQLNQCNVLFRNGVMQYITEAAELRENIDFYLKQKNRQAHKARVKELCERFNIKPFSAEEKSENLCNWIKEYLQNRV